MKTNKLFVAALALFSLVGCGTCPTGQETDVTKENAVVETILSRRSIRQYEARPVSRDTLELIMKCGINAPNAINKQAWEVRVVDNPAVFNEIKQLMAAGNPEAGLEGVEKCFRGAPVMVFVANDTAFHYSPVDCGLLSENIMLSAWSMGVGSVCLGSPVRLLNNAPEAIEKLGFSEGYAPLVCIGLGYPAETPDAKPRDAGKVQFVE